jgi:uncharacterized membrane protein YphA (DoxX/SURF4 family)
MVSRMRFPHMRSRALLLVLRLVLGATYLVSGSAKFVSPGKASDLISSLVTIPPVFALAMSYLISCIEVVVGLALLAGLLVVPAAFVSSIFLTTAMLIGFHFASEPIDCGCFGELISTKTDSLFFVRNALLLSFSMLLLGVGDPLYPNDRRRIDET